MPQEIMPIDAEGDDFICYNCRDGLCDDCVGIPCHCTCPLGPRDKNFEEEYF